MVLPLRIAPGRGLLDEPLKTGCRLPDGGYQRFIHILYAQDG